MNYSVKDVTIIITCYKEGELLRRAMASVKAQTMQGFHVILVNDCSPDLLTNRICDELSEDDNILYIRLAKNGGSAVARNVAIERCTTTIVIPLDGDDEIPSNLVATVIDCFNKHSEADFLFGDYEVHVPETDKHTVVSCGVLANEDGHLSGETLARNWCLLGQLPYKRHVWEAVGGFKVEFSHTYEDVVFWRDVVMAEMVGQYVPQSLYVWHRSEKGKNATQSEHTFFPVRIHGLPFYDRFNPAYGREMRHYIYRYYSARLMVEELNVFLASQLEHFGFQDRLKAKLMYLPTLYKVMRVIKNSLSTK